MIVPATDNDIHVDLGVNRRWLIRSGSVAAELGSYRRQAYAIAFARALAFARNVELVVHSPHGTSVRHARAALTYPIALD